MFLVEAQDLKKEDVVSDVSVRVRYCVIQELTILLPIRMMSTCKLALSNDVVILTHPLTFSLVYSEAWLNKNYKQKTGTIKNTSCPIWNETLVFPVEKGDKENKLYVRVLDKDVADSDKIGEGKLDFSNVYKEGTAPIDEWISLPTHFHLSDKGKVHLKVEFTPETEPAAAAPATQTQQQ